MQIRQKTLPLLCAIALSLAVMMGACKETGVDADTANVLHPTKDTTIGFIGTHLDSVGNPAIPSSPVRQMTLFTKAVNGKRDTLRFAMSEPLDFSHSIIEDTVLSFGLNIRMAPVPGATVSCTDCPLIQSIHVNIPRMRLYLKKSYAGPYKFLGDPASGNLGISVIYRVHRQTSNEQSIVLSTEGPTSSNTGAVMFGIDPAQRRITAALKAEFVNPPFNLPNKSDNQTIDSLSIMLRY